MANNSQKTEQKNVGAEFMIEEYKQLFEERKLSTNQAEQRVNFFITIATTATGGILLLSQIRTVTAQNYYQLALVILFIVLFYGFYIFHRVMSRDVNLKATNKLLWEVQKYFATRDSSIASYIELRKKTYRGHEFRFKIIRSFFSYLRSGLIQLPILSISLIWASIVLVYLLLQGISQNSQITWAIITFFATQLILNMYYRFLLWVYSH